MHILSNEYIPIECVPDACIYPIWIFFSRTGSSMRKTLNDVVLLRRMFPCLESRSQAQLVIHESLKRNK